MVEEWRTYQHLNNPLRFMGMTGVQLMVAVLSPLLTMMIGLSVTFVTLIIEAVAITYLRRLQRGGDIYPFRTMQIRNNTPSSIRDKDFYDLLISEVDDKESK